MTRQEAIDNIQDAFGAVVREFCVGEKEQRDTWNECRESLRALGVTDEELET